MSQQDTTAPLQTGLERLIRLQTFEQDKNEHVDAKGQKWPKSLLEGQHWPLAKDLNHYRRGRIKDDPVIWA